jgi:hypothetical protein
MDLVVAVAVRHERDAPVRTWEGAGRRGRRREHDDNAEHMRHQQAGESFVSIWQVSEHGGAREASLSRMAPRAAVRIGDRP